jgi:hypothetical protein
MEANPVEMSKSRQVQNVRKHLEIDQSLKSELYKFRFSVLWLFGEVTLLTFLVLEFMEQGVMEGIIAGNMRGLPLGPGTLLFYAVSLLIPLVMSFLSLTLKDSMNRWANIIVGIVYTGLYLMDLVAHLAVPSAYAILMGAASVVAQLLIVWYAWKWV